MNKRVVVTACSAITPIGHGQKEIVASLKQGVSGIKPIRDAFIGFQEYLYRPT